MLGFEFGISVSLFTLMVERDVLAFINLMLVSSFDILLVNQHLFHTKDFVLDQKTKVHKIFKSHKTSPVHVSLISDVTSPASIHFIFFDTL